jgi:hypothetical protein
LLCATDLSRQAAAWVLEGHPNAGRISGVAKVLGDMAAQSSCRSKLTGIFSIFVMMKKLCKYFNITSGRVEIACACQSAIHKIFHARKPNLMTLILTC